MRKSNLSFRSYKGNGWSLSPTCSKHSHTIQVEKKIVISSQSTGSDISKFDCDISKFDCDWKLLCLVKLTFPK